MNLTTFLKRQIVKVHARNVDNMRIPVSAFKNVIYNQTFSWKKNLQVQWVSLLHFIKQWKKKYSQFYFSSFRNSNFLQTPYF